VTRPVTGLFAFPQVIKYFSVTRRTLSCGTQVKDEITTLRQRLADRDTTITTLRGFKDQALARLAAQHDEITRLRTQNKRAATVRLLPVPGTESCTPSTPAT
jgi:hypothetical protein